MDPEKYTEWLEMKIAAEAIKGAVEIMKAAPSQPKWEHKVFVYYRGVDPEDLTETLNSLGNEGWELVAVEPETNDHYPTYYFKRQKVEE